MYGDKESTPTPVRFANHLSPCPGERKGARLAAGISSTSRSGGEVARAQPETEWGYSGGPGTTGSIQ
jgi:hypothetical protein